MTAFFVTDSWRPISLAQTPSFHNAMSAAARSGVHSCVIDPYFLLTLAKRPLRSFVLRAQKAVETVCYVDFLTSYMRKKHLSEIPRK